MKPPYSVFLERRGYKLRRVMDAARLLPLAGFALFMGPMFLGASSTRNLTIFLFVLWVALICVSAFLSRILAREVAGTQSEESET